MLHQPILVKRGPVETFDAREARGDVRAVDEIEVELIFAVFA